MYGIPNFPPNTILSYKWLPFIIGAISKISGLPASKIRKVPKNTPVSYNDFREIICCMFKDKDIKSIVGEGMLTVGALSAYLESQCECINIKREFVEGK